MPSSLARRLVLLWIGLAVATRLPVEAGSTVTLLADALSATEARVEAVVGARSEVFVSTFIVGHEPFSLTALALLRDAARRGVDVRLLVDAQWNKMPTGVEAHLLSEGVRIHEYHPFTLRHPLWITKRLHDKLLIVDGEELILGGRNVESPYFGFGRQLERADYLDLDLRVLGPPAAEARAYFLEVWSSRHVRASRASVPPDELADAARELDRHWAWLHERIEAARTGREKSPSPTTLEIESIRFLHDPPEGKGRAPGVGSELLARLDAATRSVRIESAYLIPVRALRRALRAAVERGVAVRILTNSLATTDNLWAQAGYVGRRDDLVRMGVSLWEYGGPESVHTKAGVLDDRTVVVGSFNLDPRSARLNTEVALVLESEALALEVSRLLDLRLARAVELDSRGWPRGAGEPFPGVPQGKVCHLRLLQLLAPLIRSQL